MKPFTREQLLATWAKYGTVEPLTEEKITHMLKVLNEPIAPAPVPKLCGRSAMDRYRTSYVMRTAQVCNGASV